jgi:hypothetical protein
MAASWVWSADTRIPMLCSFKNPNLKTCRVFLNRWKDADPDIPALKQAKAEYAKLK